MCIRLPCVGIQGTVPEDKSGLVGMQAPTPPRAERAADEPPPSVVADDTQTHCAVSGERLEAVWVEEQQEWRYLGAERLDEQEAAR